MGVGDQHENHVANHPEGLPSFVILHGAVDNAERMRTFTPTLLASSHWNWIVCRYHHAITLWYRRAGETPLILPGTRR